MQTKEPQLGMEEKGPQKLIKINETVICSSKAEKLLGILIDNKLTFDQHVSNLCVKANQKLHALSRISSYMSTKKRKLIMNSFITSQFGYCPLVWMFHSRELNNRINRIHERSLRIVYNDKQSTFHELLISHIHGPGVWDLMPKL